MEELSTLKGMMTDFHKMRRNSQELPIHTYLSYAELPYLANFYVRDPYKEIRRKRD
jgi:hypothetical protein